MSNRNHKDDGLAILDFEDDALIANADPEFTAPTGQRSNVRMPGLLRQHVELPLNSILDRPRECVKSLLRRPGRLNGVEVCHWL